MPAAREMFALGSWRTGHRAVATAVMSGLAGVSIPAILFHAGRPKARAGGGATAACLANWTMALSLAVTLLLLCAAAAKGIQISVRLSGGLICLVGQTFTRPFIDPILHRADIMLGVDIIALIRGVAGIPHLPATLAVAYKSSFPLIFFSVLAFALTGRSERAWELCGVFNLCLLAAAVSSVIFPATGSFLYLPVPQSAQSALPPGAGTYYLADLFALRHADSFVIDPTHLQGVAVFPSFHAMLALMTAAAWRGAPRISIPMAAWQGFVIFSAIPIGGHYVIDLVGGAICWAVAHLVWQKAVRSGTNSFPAAASGPCQASGEGRAGVGRSWREHQRRDCRSHRRCRGT